MKLKEEEALLPSLREAEHLCFFSSLDVSAPFSSSRTNAERPIPSAVQLLVATVTGLVRWLGMLAMNAGCLFLSDIGSSPTRSP